MIARLAAGVTWLICGARIRWRSELPAGRQRIYFANHTSHLDAVVLWVSLPPALREKTRPVAAHDYWTKNQVRSFFARRVFNAVLIERRKVTTRHNPLDAMLEAMDTGSSLILFPEGTRSDLPEPRPFKSGLFHLARKRADVDLVPVYLENLNRVLPKGEFLPVPILASVTVGEPIRFDPNEKKEKFLERARQAVSLLRL